MILKFLIIEDDPMMVESNRKICVKILEKYGFSSEDSVFDSLGSVAQFKEKLAEDFIYNILIIDITLTDNVVRLEELSEIFQNDIFRESRIIIHTSNNKILEEHEILLNLAKQGVKDIAIKADFDDYDFKTILEKCIRDLRNDLISNNIGKLAPLWKRKYFNESIDLWKNIKDGIRKRAIILIADIADSTRFINAQLEKSEYEHFPLELLKAFANDSSQIIEGDKYKGFIERISGDEILAYFILPDHANIIKDREINHNSEDIKTCVSVINAAKEMIAKFNENFNALNKVFNYSMVDKDGSIPEPQLRILLGYGDVNWVLVGTDSRPQLSIMTKKVAECYRAFSHREGKNLIRVMERNSIYVTRDLHNILKTKIDFDSGMSYNVRNFESLAIYKTK